MNEKTRKFIIFSCLFIFLCVMGFSNLLGILFIFENDILTYLDGMDFLSILIIYIGIIMTSIVYYYDSIEETLIMSKPAKIIFISVIISLFIIPIVDLEHANRNHFTSEFNYTTGDQSVFNMQVNETCFNLNFNQLKIQKLEFQTVEQLCTYYQKQIKSNAFCNLNFQDYSKFRFQLIQYQINDAFNVTLSQDYNQFTCNLSTETNETIYFLTGIHNYQGVWANRTDLTYINRTIQFEKDLFFVQIICSYRESWNFIKKCAPYFEMNFRLIIDNNYEILLIINEEFQQGMALA